MARVACVLAILTCAASIGAGGSSARGPLVTVATSTPTSAANESAAQAEAASLLAKLPLPPGAAQSATEPAEDDSLLVRPGAMLTGPNLVDDHTWWVVPGAAADVLSYIRAHIPAGMARLYRSALKGPNVPDNEAEAFGWPPIAGALSTRWLDVYVVQLSDGSTGLRADGQAVWVTSRPASETIPQGSHILRVSVHGSLKGEQPAQPPLRVTSIKKIAEVVAALDALPAAQPGPRSCPADFGISVRLAFYASRGAPALALAGVDPQGCGGVQLTIDGKPQPGLEGGDQLVRQIDRALGVKLDTSPPS